MCTTHPSHGWSHVQAKTCDSHVDALSSLQTAISRGYNIDLLRGLAKLYVEQSFITENEADAFLSDIPVIRERDMEQQFKFNDQVFTDPESDLGCTIELMRSCGRVVAKLVHSGVAAHLINGQTIHHFFCHDIESNSTLEHGTCRVT